MDTINKQLLQRKNLDDPNELEDVASATECTGLIPTPPIDESQAESYTDLFTIPKPEKGPPHRLQREKKTDR